MTAQLDAFLSALEALTPEDRAGLARRGCVLPRIGAASGTQAKFAYRCKSCGRFALEFVGDTFDNGAGGIMDLPPTGLRFEHIPWVQPRLPLEQVSRASPRCQFCRAEVINNNGHPITKYIVNVAEHQASADKAHELMAQAKRKREPIMSHNTDGTPIQLAQHYEPSDDSLLKQSRTPEAVAAVEQLAAKHDLLGHLARGPSGTRKVAR